MSLDHPLRRTFLFRTAIEFKGSSNSNHYAMIQKRLQAVHEYFLFRCTQCHPDNIRAIFFYRFSYRLIIKLIDSLIWQFDKLHLRYIRIFLHEIVSKSIQNGP